MVEVAARRKVISGVFEGLKTDGDYSILNMPIHEVSLVIIGPRVVVDVVSQIIIQPDPFMMGVAAKVRVRSSGSDHPLYDMSHINVLRPLPASQ